VIRFVVAFALGVVGWVVVILAFWVRAVVSECDTSPCHDSAPYFYGLLLLAVTLWGIAAAITWFGLRRPR
jgi:hypothetical protein